MGTAAFVAANQQPRASQYYQTFPSEPVQPSAFLQVDRVFPIASMNAFKLFTGIASRAPKSVLVVSHGFGGGLGIPLTSKPKPVLGEDEISRLNEYVNRSITEREAATRLEVTTSDVSELGNAILRVRQLRLEKLVIRACLVGRVETLENLRRLFGSTTACAPDDVLDSFGRIDPGSPASPRELAKFIESTAVIVEGSAPNRFAWSVTISDEVKLEVKTESRKGLTDWVARHFPKGKYPGTGPLAFHAQIVADRLVFPLDQEYRTHLKEVGASKKP
jgi:hypothetical protein